jgi:hypothetical protein
MAECKDLGRVLRSSTREFTFNTELPEPDVPVFGSFVKAKVQKGTADVFGLIYDIIISDDPFVKQLAVVDDIDEEMIQDQRRNRQVPIEVNVLSIGYRRAGVIYQVLPMQPPISMDHIFTCSPEEVRAFTSSFDYFKIVLETRDVPNDELLAACLRHASGCFAERQTAREFLLEAGRELARLLNNDLTRLNGILRRIRP